MIPKTELIYSFPYNKLFNSSFTRKNFLKLRKECQKFEKLYKKHINKILKLIEKYHSKKWKHKFIPIYVVNKRCKRCFSSPLTIVFRGNEKYTLIMLTHELLHNNSFGKKKFKTSRELHKYMEPILNKVLLDLDINLKKELKIFNKKTMAIAKKIK